MEKQNFAWLSLNEEEDDEGSYLVGKVAFEPERAALKDSGAPDTDEIEFISIEPEKRDQAMVEAKVTERFAAWAKCRLGTVEGEAVPNGESNLIYYDE